MKRLKPRWFCGGYGTNKEAAEKLFCWPKVYLSAKSREARAKYLPQR
jgi:hypothetical protein